MAYEIRVVFQSLEAYQSAVERLYTAFGVGVTGVTLAAEANGMTGGFEDPSQAALVGHAVEDPSFPGGQAYSFVVEDRTR